MEGVVVVRAEGERLNNPRVRLAPLPELLEGESVVVVFVHLIEDLVDSFLRSIVVLSLRLLALKMLLINSVSSVSLI